MMAAAIDCSAGDVGVGGVTGAAVDGRGRAKLGGGDLVTGCSARRPGRCCCSLVLNPAGFILSSSPYGFDDDAACWANGEKASTLLAALPIGLGSSLLLPLLYGCDADELDDPESDGECIRCLLLLLLLVLLLYRFCCAGRGTGGASWIRWSILLALRLSGRGVPSDDSDGDNAAGLEPAVTVDARARPRSAGSLDIRERRGRSGSPLPPLWNGMVRLRSALRKGTGGCDGE